MLPSATGSPSPIPMTRSRRPSRCAHSVAPTASTAPSWLSPASTTGHLRAMLSPRHCPGWPVGWTLPGCRGFRHRPPGHPLRLPTPSPSAADTGSVGIVPDEPETPAGQPDIDPGYSSSGVPTFESVREKIESRYETSIGSAELDAETPEGRDVEDQYEARQRAAADRLAQIRESMRDDSH